MPFTHSFVYVFKNYLLSGFYGPWTELGARNTLENNTWSFVLMGHIFWRRDRQSISTYSVSLKEVILNFHCE